MTQSGSFEMEDRICRWHVYPDSHFPARPSLQDPEGSLFQNEAVPDKLKGLVPTLEGEEPETSGVPGSFKYLSSSWGGGSILEGDSICISML